MKPPPFLPAALLTALAILANSSCVTRRIVTEGDRTVSEEYVLKRPIRDAIENSND